MATTNEKKAALAWNRRLSVTEYTERRITFGKYTGSMIKDLPQSYLEWAVINFSGIWAEYLAREVQRRDPRLRRLGQVPISPKTVPGGW